MSGKKKANTPKVNFYDEFYLASKLNTDRRHFHRAIKPIILSDFPEILENLKVSNPDIGLDRNGIIYLADTNHNILISTEINISLSLEIE